MQELTWVFATPNRKCTTIKLQSQITWEYRSPSKWWHPELHHLKKLTHRLTVHVILPQLYEPFLAIRWALYQDNESSSCFALLLVAGMHFGSYQEHFGSLFSVRVMAFISCCLALLVAEGFLLNPLSTNGDEHQFSPNNIHTSSREKVMRINKMITKKKCLDLLSNSLNTFFKKMYRNQFGEFVCGYWGLKG